jgi:hypothetical protein
MIADTAESREAAAARAACAALGLAPDQKTHLGETPRKARILAAAVIRARTGEAAKAVALRWRIHGPELSPTMLVRAGVTTDLMLTVAEALDWGAPEAVAEAAPQALVETPPSAAALEPEPEPERQPDPEPIQTQPATTPGASPFKRAAAGLGGPDSAARALAARREMSARGGSRVMTLKPVTARIASWSSHFLEAGWHRTEVAELFDVCPDALLDAIDLVEVRACRRWNAWGSAWP